MNGNDQASDFTKREIVSMAMAQAIASGAPFEYENDQRALGVRRRDIAIAAVGLADALIAELSK